MSLREPHVGARPGTGNQISDDHLAAVSSITIQPGHTPETAIVLDSEDDTAALVLTPRRRVEVIVLDDSPPTTPKPRMSTLSKQRRIATGSDDDEPPAVRKRRRTANPRRLQSGDTAQATATKRASSAESDMTQPRRNPRRGKSLCTADSTSSCTGWVGTILSRSGLAAREG
jgi:hypothetical protein